MKYILPVIAIVMASISIGMSLTEDHACEHESRDEGTCYEWANEEGDASAERFTAYFQACMAERGHIERSEK